MCGGILERPHASARVRWVSAQAQAVKGNIPREPAGPSSCFHCYSLRVRHCASKPSQEHPTPPARVWGVAACVCISHYTLSRERAKGVGTGVRVGRTVDSMRAMLEP